MALVLLITAGGNGTARAAASITGCQPEIDTDCIASSTKLTLGEGPEGRVATLKLIRGRAMVLETTFAVGRVAVGDPKVADVVILDPRQINIVPLDFGDTNLIVWEKGGNVAAAIDLQIGSNHSRLQSELRRVLENDSIVLEGSRHAVVLKGTVESPIQMQHTVDVAKALMGRPIGAEGPVGDPIEEGRLVNLLKVGGNQQVMIEVIVAEMDRRLTRRLGTNLAGVYGSGGTDVNLFSLLQGLSRLENSAAPQVLDLSSRVNFISTISRGSDSLDIFMEAIQSDGLIKILAEPNLVARSGGTAEFLVGGEVPIPVPQAGSFGSVTVEFKPFGVGVEFKPTVLTSNRIYVDVSTEVSEPNPTLGLDTGGIRVPGFNTRRAATSVELRDGESFAIAGLLRDNVSESISELPGLGDLPILGALFRSTEFERQQTELVIIATPRLVSPGAPGRPTLPTDHFVIPTAVEFFFHGSMEGKKAPPPKTDQAGKPPSPGDDSILSFDKKSPGPAPEKDALATSSLIEPGGSGSQIADSFAGEIGHELSVQGAEGELQ
jgi:pilus assembly protein CpaC